MLLNCFKVALRSLWRNRFYSLLNVTGLGIGMACFLMMSLYVRHELGYDAHHANAGRLYRIAQTIRPGDGSPDIALATNSPQVAPLLKQDFPEVEQIARLASWRPAAAAAGREGIYVDALLADASVFELFDFIWLSGNPVNALATPDAAVVTRSTAMKLFGTVDVAGRSLVLTGDHVVQVRGVIEDPPPTTHLDFDMLVAIALAPAAFNPNTLENWSAQIYHTYALLRDGAAIGPITSRFPAFIDRHMGEGRSAVVEFVATPLRELHLMAGARRGELREPGSMAAVMAFAAIGAIVLVVACINFMNLATAKGAERAREIGVRKAIGACRSQLVAGLLAETMLLAAAGMIAALALVELLLPAFSTVVRKELSLDPLGGGLIVSGLFLLMLVVGIGAGAWPAFHLSSYRPAQVLRGQVSGGPRGAAMRSALVVVQFSAAIALLVCTFVLREQMEYLRGLERGYERDDVVVLGNLGTEGVGRQWDIMKLQLLAHPGIRHASAANSIPTREAPSSYYIEHEGSAGQRSMPVVLVDFDYFETYGIRTLAGRTFAAASGQDQRMRSGAGSEPIGGTYILSREAARQLGWSPDEALGKWVSLTCCGIGQGPVVGVVDDVRSGPIREGLSPLLYAIPPEPLARISNETRLGLREIGIKLGDGDPQIALAHIDEVWKRFRPGEPITRFFLGEDFDALLLEEERRGRLLFAFSVLAIFITCLGLYGLSYHNAERRTKEIGIRKVMGGSVWSIVWLLTNDFSKLVLLSNLVAWPIAYVAMERWLENFAYRIDLSPLVFIGSGAIALCIAWVTVGGTAAKAASAKPVLALRYE